MFRKYGFMGIALIVLVGLNFFLKVEPFATLYFPLVWIGYILLVDAVVFKLRKTSLISNRFMTFLGIIAASVLIWVIFDVLNIHAKIINYQGILLFDRWQFVYEVISFATVLPAFFETVELIRALHLFDKQRLHEEHRLSKNTLHIIVGAGIICFFLPFILPQFSVPLMWLSIFLILDPINYLHKEPSILGHLKSGKLDVPLSLLLAGIVIGFMSELWNNWAVLKWTYDVPSFGFGNLFELPVVGYLSYFPFSFELYTMYWFTRGLFQHKEHLLAE